MVGDVPHTVPMLSLDNVFGAEQLADWAASLERRLGRPVDAVERGAEARRPGDRRALPWRAA